MHAGARCGAGGGSGRPIRRAADRKELKRREVKRPFHYEDLLGFAGIYSDSLGFTHAFKPCGVSWSQAETPAGPLDNVCNSISLNVDEI